jgi:hypothetical protein
VKRAFLLIAHPLKCADLISSNPVWIGQFVLLAGIGLLIHMVAYDRMVQATVEHLPTFATLADRQAMTEILTGQRWVSAALFPFRTLAGFGGTALVLYFALRGVSAGGSVQFRKSFALEVHAETVLILGKLTSCAVAVIGNQQNPYVNPFGIDQLLRREFEHISVANSINPFTVWYFALLAVGAARIFTISRWKAITAVLCTWVITLVMEESSFDLLRNFFHF